MKYPKVGLYAAAVVLAAAVTLSAQSQSGAADRYERWGERSGQGVHAKSWLPYTSYGYVWGGIGRTDHDQSGCAFSCDDRATGFKVLVC